MPSDGEAGPREALDVREVQEVLAHWTAPRKPFECKSCRYQVSVTAGTVMHRSHMPLTTWFWAAYLVTTHTPGMSAL